MKTPSTDFLPPYTKRIHKDRSTHAMPNNHDTCESVCCICNSYNLDRTKAIGPYMMQSIQPDFVTTCPCLQKAHPACLKRYDTDYVCRTCNYIYPSKKCVFLATFSTFTCHLLSLLSLIGLVFGLSQLGRVLDELALGSEIGPKIDGDETWHDQEMLQIAVWLDIVHYSTALAGQAMLGLVYIIGVCLVIGIHRTADMITNILHINLDCIYRHNVIPKQIKPIAVYICLFLLGLFLGTYLLFFSWIWSSLLCKLWKQLLDTLVRERIDAIV